MKVPVLVVVVAAHARAIRTALADDFAVTFTENPAHGRALASTGAFLAVLTAGRPDTSIAGAVVIELGAEAAVIHGAVGDAMARLAGVQRRQAGSDDVGAVPYEEYIELARYAATRRYLMALLARHAGSVTDAARGAKMKRESLHRLLRRHHLIADDFRDRT
jgi:transcriptional regulator of acetoin/glycerol metabolism